MITFKNRLVPALVLAFGLSAPAAAHDTHADATYMANEAVLVTQGELKIMFDPFYQTGFGTYPEIPEAMMAKVTAQIPPFDSIDAIFFSHVHGDHFDGPKLLAYMKTNTAVNAFMPEQGARLVRDLAEDNTQIKDRIIAFELAEGDAPITVTKGAITAEAVRIPHSGWPTGRRDINNILFRVSLADGVTVMHMGDADINDIHYAPYEDHWDARQTHHAFPPYWYLMSKDGRTILTERLKVGGATGIHVPIRLPRGLSAYDYFSKPGESRVVHLPVPEEEVEADNDNE